MKKDLVKMIKKISEEPLTKKFTRWSDKEWVSNARKLRDSENKQTLEALEGYDMKVEKFYNENQNGYYLGSKGLVYCQFDLFKKTKKEPYIYVGKIGFYEWLTNPKYGVFEVFEINPDECRDYSLCFCRNKPVPEILSYLEKRAEELG